MHFGFQASRFGAVSINLDRFLLKVRIQKSAISQTEAPNEGFDNRYGKGIRRNHPLS